MPRLHFTHRRLLAACCLSLSAVGILGCSPTPEPEPTPAPAFASEEEAFAAAEETYRAYNDAGNVAGQPSQFLTGAALEGDLETSRYLQQQNLTLSGPSTVHSFRGNEFDWAEQVATVTAEVCLDVSLTRILDEGGADVTPSDRAETWLLLVTFIGSEEQLLIADSITISGRTC